MDRSRRRSSRAPAAVRARTLHHSRRARSARPVRGSSRSVSCGRSRCATTRRSHRGTALRWPRSPSRAAGSTAPTISRPPVPRRVPPRSALDRGRPALRSWRAGQAKHAGVLEDYADVANGLYELHVATGELRWLEESRRLALLAVELFGDDERGGFFLTPSRRRAARRAQEGFRRPPDAVRELDARVRAAAPRAAVGRRRAGAPGGRRLPLRRTGPAAGAVGVRPCAECASISTSRRRASWRSSGRRTPRSPARRSPLSSRMPSSPSGRARRAAARGKDLVDGRPAVYVCERFACQAPTTNPADFKGAQPRL